MPLDPTPRWRRQAAYAGCLVAKHTHRRGIMIAVYVTTACRVGSHADTMRSQHRAHGNSPGLPLTYGRPETKMNNVGAPDIACIMQILGEGERARQAANAERQRPYSNVAFKSWEEKIRQRAAIRPDISKKPTHRGRNCPCSLLAVECLF